MAKPIGSRKVARLDALPLQTPGLAVVPVTLWSPPQGVDYLNASNRIGTQHAKEIVNLWIDRGVLRTRAGTEAMAGISLNPVMAVINFVTSSGVGFIIRFTTRALELLAPNNTWNAIGGSPFTGDDNNQFTFVAWGNTLVFSNGVDGLWEYSPTQGTVTRIIDGPSAKYLTAFDGRIIASGVLGKPSAIQWSAKNDSHDWTGTGSGIDELLSTPGGLIDEQMGVHPISDSIALVARSNSIWQATITGDPDAPFKFARLYANLGTRSPRSIDVFPGGLFMLGNDDVYIINEREFKAIGQRIRDQIGIAGDKHCGRYIPKYKEYRLSTNSSDLYRYSLVDEAWSLSRYPFEIRDMAVTLASKSGLSIDEMLGSMDNQVGAIDSLAGAQTDIFLAFTTKESAGRVVKEVEGSTKDKFTQVGFSAVGWSIRSGTLMGGNPLEKTQLLEAQLEMEYRSEPSKAIIINYSINGGFSWDQYSSVLYPTTIEQTIKSATRTIEGRNIQLELTSDSLDDVRLYSMTTFLVKGARIRP